MGMRGRGGFGKRRVWCRGWACSCIWGWMLLRLNEEQKGGVSGFVYEVAGYERFDCRGEWLGAEGWEVGCVWCCWCTGSHQTLVGPDAYRDLRKAKLIDQKSRMEIHPSGTRLTATFPHFRAAEVFVEPPHVAHQHHQELQNHHSTFRLAPHPLLPVSFSAVYPSFFWPSKRIQSLRLHTLRTPQVRWYI